MMPDSSRGLYRKYHVARVDGEDLPGRRKDNARYFVLDIGNDPHARKALETYIESLGSEFPDFARFAQDLRELLDSTPLKERP